MKKFGVSILLLCLSLQINSQDTGSFIDGRDGHEYKWLKIEDQLWMIENLQFASKTGSWVYDDDEKYAKEYGRLYNYGTAQKVCPSDEGWRLPSKNDYEILLNAFGGKGTVANKALIKGGESGFSSMFGGWHVPAGFGFFLNIDKIGYYWSATPKDELEGWHLMLGSGDSSEAAVFYFDKNYGFSVRCVKDQ